MFYVNPGDALGNGADNFIGDCAGVRRRFFHGDPFVAVFAEDGHDIVY
jgi:hypothetical protein